MPRGSERLLALAAWLSGLIILGGIAAVVGYLLRQGLESLQWELIFGSADPFAVLLGQQRVFQGLFPALIGTLTLVLLSVALALPPGLAAGIYLAEYAHGRLRRVGDLLFDILAGLPSIVIGLFGLSLAIALHRHLTEHIQPCLLLSALSLAILVLPYIVRSTQLALEHLPPRERLTALALGASKLQNIGRVLLPRAMPSVASGVVLAIGRCAEDTAVIMLTGAVTSAGVPHSLLARYEALPFFIFYTSSQYSDRQELANGYGAALLLLLLCLALFALAGIISRGVTWWSGLHD